MIRRDELGRWIAAGRHFATRAAARAHLAEVKDRAAARSAMREVKKAKRQLRRKGAK